MFTSVHWREREHFAATRGVSGRFKDDFRTLKTVLKRGSKHKKAPHYCRAFNI
jgi:hypothetical protein